MQGIKCTVRYPTESDGDLSPGREALLTREHSSSARGVPVVVVAGEAAGAKELAGTVVLAEAPADTEAEDLVRSARMNGYRVESPR